MNYITGLWKSKGGKWFFFYLPSIVFLSAVIIYPLVRLGMMSLTSFNLLMDTQPVFIGLQNFKDVFIRGEFLHSLFVTSCYVGLATSSEIIVGFIIALLFYQNLKGFSVLRTFLLMPLMMMPVITGLNWRYIFNNEYGLLQYIASLIGIRPPVWFSHPVSALLALVIVDVWQYTPFSALILLAGLQTLPPSLVEAASLDGASHRHIVVHMMIPWLKRIFLIILLLRVIDGYRLFDYIWVLSKGGPGTATESIVYHTYIWTFMKLEMGYGSSLAFLVFIMSIIAGVFLVRELEKTNV